MRLPNLPLFVPIVLCLLPGLAELSAQTAPNRKEVVEFVSDEDRARFACAHTGRSCEADWIKAVAAALHAEDARWGLNGKRGDPNVLSLDVVTFRVGPTDRHVEAFDICGACGGGNPSVVWNNITNYATMGQPGTAVWVKPPTAIPAPTPTPTPTPVPVPVPVPAPQPVDLAPLLAAIESLRAEVAVLRGQHDTFAGVAVEARDQAFAAAVESLNAANRAAEILAKQSQCYTGRFPGMFGSKDVRVCPVP